MRIVATSDLHYPYRIDRNGLKLLVEQIASTKPDVVLLAGDLVSYLNDSYLRTVFSKFARLSCPVGVVAGNHDLWTPESFPGDSWYALGSFCTIAQEFGFSPLDRAILFEVKDAAFVGSISWFDYSFGSSLWSPEFYDKMEFGNTTWMDKHYIRWFNVLIKTHKYVCEKFIERLRICIDFANQLNKSEKEIIAVTHMPVLRDSVLFTGEPVWDFFGAYMGSERIGQMLQNEGVRLSIHGHSHDDYRKIPEHAVSDNLHSFNVCYYPHRPFRVFDKTEEGWKVMRYDI